MLPLFHVKTVDLSNIHLYKKKQYLVVITLHLNTYF
jgi:hypothetical protein